MGDCLERWLHVNPPVADRACTRAPHGCDNAHAAAASPLRSLRIIDVACACACVRRLEYILKYVFSKTHVQPYFTVLTLKMTGRKTMHGARAAVARKFS
jgi:hypothetical protein